MPLAKGGAKREVIEEIIAQLTNTHDILKKEMLDLTSLFASLAFKNPKDQEWLARRFAMLEDILSETPMHKFYMERAAEKVQEQMSDQIREKIIRDLLSKQQLIDSRETFLELLQERFPQLSKVAKKKVDQITDPSLLKKLMFKVIGAQTVEEASYHLLMLDQTDETEE